MELFIDTANIDEIREVATWGILTGVTTNPSLIAKEKGSDFKSIILEILHLVDGAISVEVTAEDAEGMVKEGKEFATWHKNVVIKVPITEEGIKAIAQLSKAGIKTNATLCFSANQALLVARAGATYVSPFVGRVDDISMDGITLIEDIADLFHIHDLATKVLAASIRTPLHVTQCALAGADVATCPYKVLKNMVRHPLTDKGIEQFTKDWQTVKTS